MSDIGMQKRYFQSKLRKYEKRPELHRALIDDCRHYLQMLEECDSPVDFKRRVEEEGNMFSSARAEVTARYANRISVFRALGQKRKLSEDRQRLEVIAAAEGHADLAQKLEAFEGESSLTLQENSAMNHLDSIISALFQLCTDMPGSNDEERSLAKFREYWRLMQEADPEVSWEKIVGYPPYRDRIVFTDEQLKVIGKKFQEVAHG